MKKKRPSVLINEQRTEQGNFRLQWLGLVLIPLIVLIIANIPVYYTWIQGLVNVNQQAAVVATSFMIPYTHRTNGNVRFENIGPIAAENVTASITISSLRKEWVNVVNDISDFSFKVLPPNVNVEMEYSNREIQFDMLEITGNKTVIFKTDTLGANKYFNVQVRINNTTDLLAYGM